MLILGTTASSIRVNIPLGDVTFDALQTASGGTGTITFSNISQNYTDLLLAVSARSNRAETEDSIRVRVGNGSVDTGNNYSEQIIFNINGSISPYQTSPQSYILMTACMTANSSSSNAFGNSALYLSNYRSNGTKAFSLDMGFGNMNNIIINTIQAGHWSGTSAIDVMTLTPNLGSTFNSNSTFTLYGIKNS